MKLLDLFKKSLHVKSQDQVPPEAVAAPIEELQTPPTIPNFFNGYSSQMDFITQYFDVYDSRFPDCGIPVNVQGKIFYLINDISHFQDLCKIYDCTEETIHARLEPIVVEYLKNCISIAPSNLNIPVNHLNQHVIEISNYVKSQTTSQIEDTYGITIQNVVISDLYVDVDSENYLLLKSLTTDMENEKRLAKHTMEMSNMNLQFEYDQRNFKTQNDLQLQQYETKSKLEMEAMKRRQELDLGGQEKLQKIQLNNQDETLRIQREEMQRASKLQTEQTFFDAHQFNENTKKEILFEQTRIAENAKQERIERLEKEERDRSAKEAELKATPTVDDYYIAVNQEAVGPYNWEKLQKLVWEGYVSRKTLVWKEAMPDWKPAGEVVELSGLFNGR